MGYKLVVTHKPTGAQIEYGPWASDDNPDVEKGRLHFAQGFVLGTEAVRRGEDYKVEEYAFDVQEVSDGTTVGRLVATASASVQRADGSTE